MSGINTCAQQLAALLAVVSLMGINSVNTTSMVFWLSVYNQLVREIVQHFQIAGNSLEPFLPSQIRNFLVATLIASGMVKTKRIGQSAAKLPHFAMVRNRKKVQRLNGSGGLKSNQLYKLLRYSPSCNENCKVSFFKGQSKNRGGLNLQVTFLIAVDKDLRAVCHSYVSSNYGKSEQFSLILTIC